MTDKPKTKILEDGRIGFLDDQGNVVAVQAENQQNRKRIAEGKPPKKTRFYTPYYTRYNGNGVAFMLPGGWAGAKNVLKNLPDDYSYWDNHNELLRTIAALVSEGHTLRQIENMRNPINQEPMPPMSAILFWEGHDERFREVMAAARRARGEQYHDKIVDVVDQVEENNAKSSKVKIDGLKWLAETDDRDKYGSQTKVTGGSPSVNIVFQTGITREEIPAEGKVIEQEEPEDG